MIPRGGCEFVEDFARVLPIEVFLELVDLPHDDKAFLLPLADIAVRSPDPVEREHAHRKVGAYLHQHVIDRRATPGTDLLSGIVGVQIGEDRISEEDAVTFATIVLFGGLDTVASLLGFLALFLAEQPRQRRQIVKKLDDEKYLAAVVEELMRRYGNSSTARVVVADCEYKGIQFKAGDIVETAPMLVGLDDRLNPDPLLVDFDRGKPVHSVFGVGPHACPGAMLARREFRVFLQEWLSRIPEFEIRSGTRPLLVTGHVSGVLELHLAWPL